MKELKLSHFGKYVLSTWTNLDKAREDSLKVDLLSDAKCQDRVVGGRLPTVSSVE